jgi:hypothetical protein
MHSSHFSARFRAVLGMWCGRLPQVHWTLIAGRGAPSVTFRMLRQISCRSPSLHYPGVDLSAWIEDDP